MSEYLKMSVYHIAHALLRKAAQEGITMSAVKLHCLLYYVQGQHLAMTGMPAFPAVIVAAEDCPRIPVLDRFINHYLPDLKEGEYPAAEVLARVEALFKDQTTTT